MDMLSHVTRHSHDTRRMQILRVITDWRRAETVEIVCTRRCWKTLFSSSEKPDLIYMNLYSH